MHFPWKRRAMTALAALTATLMVGVGPVTTAQAAEEYPDVMLGVFTNSQKDATDTFFASYDGVNFQRISEAFVDENPNDASKQWAKGSGSAENPVTVPGASWKRTWKLWPFSCPSIIYHNGYFWMLANESNGGDDGKLRLVVSFSKDLVNWADQKQIKVDVPNLKAGNNDKTRFDAVAADWAVMPNGKIAVVVSMGRYGSFHGQSEKDTMYPYLVTFDELSTTKDPAKNPMENQVTERHSAATLINLPIDSYNDTHNNRIDGSWYFEGDHAYLSIKRKGVTNEIYSTDKNLSNVGNKSSWKTVNANVLTGYEAPSMTKFNGRYYYFTDELATWTPDDHVRKPYQRTGTHVQIGTTMTNFSGVKRVQAIGKNANGSIRNYTVAQNNNANGDGPRHGTVITVTDPAAKKVVWERYHAQKYAPAQTMYHFWDVKYTNNRDHEDDVEWLGATGITTGFPDGSFGGLRTVIRQDMAAFLYRLAGSPAFDEASAANPFSDVVKGKTPHSKEILWLASTGITTGWDIKDADGNVIRKEFRPGANVVRQDMSAFLHRLADYQKATPTLGTALKFTDVTMDGDNKTPHAEDIEWLSRTGVTTGWIEKDGTRTFRGGSSVVRQDMAAFLHRMSVNVL